jgi:hypothetical protein
MAATTLNPQWTFLADFRSYINRGVTLVFPVPECTLINLVNALARTSIARTVYLLPTVWSHTANTYR